MPIIGLILAIAAFVDEPKPPKVEPGWKVELVAKAPEILFPTAIVQDPAGTLYIGQDPMDMPGPPTKPIDSIVAIDPRTGKKTVFAEGLWSVMGLEWVDDRLIVVHPPYLSSLRDENGDGRADRRDDLVTGLGPIPPGFNGINDHVVSGPRLGMDGFLYISVGDKGIPRAVGKDGASIRLHGGGVIRVRPDGSALEVVSTGERNPLSAMLNAADDVFTYGNDDDSKKWPNSLTHHIIGGHYGYPYQFLTRPDRALPIVAGQVGGSGTQGVCGLDESLPPAFRGNLFVCDWGLQRLDRIVVEPIGGAFRQVSREPIVTKGDLADFRPFGICPATDGSAFYLTDWAYTGWLADGPMTGRVYRIIYEGPDKPAATPIPGSTIAALDHPSASVRLRSQRLLARDPSHLPALVARLRKSDSLPGRAPALWALDEIGLPEAVAAIREALSDADPSIRLQAAKRSGIRRDQSARIELERLLRDPDDAVRRESAIALGAIANPASYPSLLAAIGEPDRVVSWSIRRALHRISAWEKESLVAALVDPSRQAAAIRLLDEAYSPIVAESLVEALGRCPDARARAGIVTDLAGLFRREPAWSGTWFGTNPLAGPFPEKTENWDPKAMSVIAGGLAQGLVDPDREVRGLALISLANQVGTSASDSLRARLAEESDPKLQILLVTALGGLRDARSVPILSAIVADPKRPEALRGDSIDALIAIGGARASRSGFALLYDKAAPPTLVARALTALGQLGALPANDVVGFLDNPAPIVRASALRSLAIHRNLPGFVTSAIVARLSDPAPEVRLAAIEAVTTSRIHDAVPALLGLLNDESSKSAATLALAAIPDRRAFLAYLETLNDRNPEHRRAAEAALLAIRDQVAPALEERARAGKFAGPASEAVERILTRFTPILDWRVIGPFPRTTARVFFADKSIDFQRHHVGAEGRDIAWQARKAEPSKGRVVLDDLRAGSGDRGGFGYDPNSSPELAAFAFAEIPSDRDRDAFLLVGSSGTITVWLNEQEIHNYSNFSGRAYLADSDRVRVRLKAGSNRLLVRARQGIGRWSFGVQVSDPGTVSFATRPAPIGLDALRNFALSHEGDRSRGESLFFDPKGVNCARCHSSGGRGTTNIGPDLTGLASKYDRAEIIRSVLEPSNRLATGYQPILIALDDGKVLSGLVRSETDSEIELVDTDSRTFRVAKSRIEARRVGEVSIMPVGLVDSLKPEEFADLVAYLMSLKVTPAPAAR